MTSIKVLLVGNSIICNDIGFGSGTVVLVKSEKNILIDTGLLGFTIKSKIIDGLEKEGIQSNKLIR